MAKLETSEPKEGAKKRKGEDLGGSPAKRLRVGSRDTARVKEYPAGNVATSSSRMAFLQSLCSIPNFQKMIDLVPMVVSSLSLKLLSLLNPQISAQGCTHSRQFPFLGFLEKP